MVYYLFCVTIPFLIIWSSKGSVFEESVCLGGELTLNCSTNETLLQWTITIPQYRGPVSVRLITSDPQSDNVLPYLPGVAGFLFLRTSISPLASMILIENVTFGLNGTRVECCYGGKVVETTIINVIENATIFLSPFNISTSKMLGRENVTVTINWTQAPSSVIKSTSKIEVAVMVIPCVEVEVSFQSAQLVVNYNIQYTVNVTKALCGQNITEKIELHYVNRCNFTLLHPQLMADYHLMIISPDYSYNYSVGMSVNLSCHANDSFELIPTSPTLTCGEDGQWSPNLSQIMCVKGYSNCTIPSNGSMNYNSTLENSTQILQFWCKVGFLPADIFTAICTPNGSWIPNPDDHTCTAIEDANLIVVTSSSLGVALGVIIVLALILTLIIVRRSKGSVHTKKTRALDIKTEQMQTHDLEFSKQASVRGQSQSTVLYADLGPLSFKRQPHIPTLSINDDKVEYAQLQTYSDMKKVQPTIKGNQNCADSKLNLNILLLQIRADITPKWYEFGEAIGVMKEVLDKWMQYPPDQSIIEVCDHWLRNCGGQPTWRKVAKALKKIGYQQLASDIENVYKTGKLPLESDENKGTPVAAVITQDLPVDETPPPIPPRL